MSSVTQLVSTGPLLLAMPVAAAAGAVTFLSPCCLPLVPGYLSFITGMTGAAQAAQPTSASSADFAGPDGVAASGTAGSGTAAGAGVAVAARPVASPMLPARGRVVGATALFVLGFSLVFAIEGAAIGGLGTLVTGHAREVTRALGVVTIVLGLLFAGALDRFAFAGRIVKPSARPRAGLAGAPLLGVMFGLGWTPCTGPTLSAVLGLSAVAGTAPRGAVLAFIYALGLGVPFLLVALGFQRAARAFAFARRRARLITVIGGGLLVCVGLLEVTGAWYTFMSWLQTHWAGYQLPL
jgi:cytochrome c-type biogenesis protein